jgi:hypothetical protein
MNKTKALITTLGLLTAFFGASPVLAESAIERYVNAYCNTQPSVSNGGPTQLQDCQNRQTPYYYTAIAKCNSDPNSSDVDSQASLDRCVEREAENARNPTPTPTTPNPSATSPDFGSAGPPTDGKFDCHGVAISINVECTDATNPILAYLGGITNFLSMGVGVVLVISLVVLGMQYIMSAGDPQRVKLAKDRAVNIVLAGATYFLIYAILKWLIPGGF